MRVLMLGWEYPPRMTGGLGIACQGLVRGLLGRGAQVLFLMPGAGEIPPQPAPDFELRFSGKRKRLQWRTVPSRLTPYPPYTLPPRSALASAIGPGTPSQESVAPVYPVDLFEEVDRYAFDVEDIARRERFDVIHAHDWMSFPAARRARTLSGKPFIAHVHSIELDRAGPVGNPDIKRVEGEGLAAADLVIAVSRYTAERICDTYAISPDRVRVVLNAADAPADVEAWPEPARRLAPPAPFTHMVLFVGRLAEQKGPDTFLQAARRLLDFEPGVLFVLAGGGGMEPALIDESLRLGISDHVVFVGQVPPKEVWRYYQMADVLVLPSRSEPFGITALEAMQWGIPCIVSRHAGVTELSPHCLRVESWDVDAIVDRLHALLNARESLGFEMTRRARAAAVSHTWSDAAGLVIGVYREFD